MAVCRLPPPRQQVRLQKQLTELEKQFYGSSMAYDRAMAGQEALDKVCGGVGVCFGGEG